MALGIARWLLPMSPGGVLIVLVAAAMAFFWLFGILRRIDRNELELRRLNIARDCAVTQGETGPTKS